MNATDLMKSLREGLAPDATPEQLAAAEEQLDAILTRLSNLEQWEQLDDLSRRVTEVEENDLDERLKQLEGHDLDEHNLSDFERRISNLEEADILDEAELKTVRDHDLDEFETRLQNLEEHDLDGVISEFREHKDDSEHLSATLSEATCRISNTLGAVLEIQSQIVPDAKERLDALEQQASEVYDDVQTLLYADRKRRWWQVWK